MQFVDTVTPTNPGDYMSSVRNYPGDGNDRTRQLSSDWATMYYQNAYNTAVMNYQNEYNSPLQQMLRYQAAGLNPFLAATDNGNMSSSHPGGTPKGAFVAPSSVEQAQAAMQGIRTVNDVVQTAQGLYDYITYGRPRAQLQNENLGLQGSLLGLQEQILGADLSKHQAEAAWSNYWNGIEGSLDLSTSPRGKYMENSTAKMAAQIEQLNTLVNVLYPSQAQAALARAALDSYRTSLLQGETEPILELNTGNPEIDAVVKSVVLNVIKMSRFGVSAIF